MELIVQWRVDVSLMPAIKTMINEKECAYTSYTEENTYKAMVPNETVLHTCLNRCVICINHLWYPLIPSISLHLWEFGNSIGQGLVEPLIQIIGLWMICCGEEVIDLDSIRRRLISLWNSFPWSIVMIAGNPVSKNNCRNKTQMSRSTIII